MSVPTTKEKFSEINFVRYPEPLPISSAKSHFSFLILSTRKKVSSEGGYSSFFKDLVCKVNYFVS